MNANIQPFIHPAMDTLGARMRRRRREKSMTQEALATKAGTNQAVIQKIENGKSLRPRKIDEIASVLEVNPAWLMFGEKSGATMSEEALEVARAWSRLPDALRVRIKRQIHEQLMLNSSR